MGGGGGGGEPEKEEATRQGDTPSFHFAAPGADGTGVAGPVGVRPAQQRAVPERLSTHSTEIANTTQQTSEERRLNVRGCVRAGAFRRREPVRGPLAPSARLVVPVQTGVNRSAATGWARGGRCRCVPRPRGSRERDHAGSRSAAGGQAVRPSSRPLTQVWSLASFGERSPLVVSAPHRNRSDSEGVPMSAARVPCLHPTTLSETPALGALGRKSSKWPRGRPVWADTTPTVCFCFLAGCLDR